MKKRPILQIIQSGTSNI